MSFLDDIGDAVGPVGCLVVAVVYTVVAAIVSANL